MPILSNDVIKKYTGHEEEINIKLNPKICCPELVGTNQAVDAACTNDKCGKTVTTVPTERIVTCMNCMRENIFACLFSAHNTISLSCHEQLCLIRLYILVHLQLCVII